MVSFRFQAVADAADGVDMAPTRRFALRLTILTSMARSCGVAIAFDAVDDLVLVKTAGVGGEELHDCEFAVGKFEIFAVEFGAVEFVIDDQAIMAFFTAVFLFAELSQLGADAGNENFAAEGLGDIVGGAEFEAEDDVAFVAFGAEDDDG